MALTKHPNPNPKLHRCYPLADWSKAEILQHVVEAALPLGRAEKLLGRSLDCLNVEHVWPLKRAVPEDYERICNDFPLMDALCWLYEKRREKYGADAIMDA